MFVPLIWLKYVAIGVFGGLALKHLFRPTAAAEDPKPPEPFSLKNTGYINRIANDLIPTPKA